MKVEDLIKKLEQFPKGTDVCLFDHRKHLHYSDSGFNSAGVYTDFEVELEELGKDEIEYLKDVEDIDYKAWISISFDNEDFDNYGKKLYDDEN